MEEVPADEKDDRRFRSRRDDLDGWFDGLRGWM